VDGSYPLMAEYILGVCPAAHTGQIYYHSQNGNDFWSTLRGPQANYSTCYYFDLVYNGSEVSGSNVKWYTRVLLAIAL
jgi:hypothetical protein